MIRPARPTLAKVPLADLFLSERLIQPSESRRLLLKIRPARPTLAEVPLADLSLYLHAQSSVCAPSSFLDHGRDPTSIGTCHDHVPTCASVAAIAALSL